MGFRSNIENGSDEPVEAVRIRTRPPRFLLEFEAEIRRLYLGMMEEPVPARLLGILRAGLVNGKG